MQNFKDARNRMVDRQLRRRGVSDPAVLAAMAAVPREGFVEPALRAMAYDDSPLPIAGGQTISQPFMVAWMLEAARLTRDSRVLEVGAGSGYAAAVASRIAAEVCTVERDPDLAATAEARLAGLGCTNVSIRLGDGSLGWPEAAPFDAILVAAGAPAPPEALKTQLAAGGRLIIPVGRRDDIQRLLRITRMPDGFSEEDLGPVRFVPLVGEQGWDSGH